MKGNDHVKFCKSKLFKKFICDILLSLAMPIPFTTIFIRGKMLGGDYNYSLNSMIKLYALFKLAFIIRLKVYIFDWNDSFTKFVW